MRRDLVIPQEFAGEMIEIKDRIGVEIVSRSARTVRIACDTRKGSGIANPPIGIACRSVDCRRIPDPAATVDLRVSPEIIGHGLKLPAWLACIGIDRKDHPARAALITAKLDRTWP